ncbi:hypothetical protein FACS189413_14390 [Bacteroidia bacterium]|nr:hypothetical protein FACS189413_14390 [Bacteroidia bacterium]
MSHGGGGLFGPPPVRDNFFQKKNVYGINAKFGQQILFKIFLIEWHTGLGLAYNNVRHYDRDDDLEEGTKNNISVIIKDLLQTVQQLRFSFVH